MRTLLSKKESAQLIILEVFVEKTKNFARCSS